jgi:hypothetical protein
VKASVVHAITTKEFPTKAARPANARLDLSRLRLVFGVTTPPWQQAFRRELGILVQRGRNEPRETIRRAKRASIGLNYSRRH